MNKPIRYPKVNTSRPDVADKFSNVFMHFMPLWEKGTLYSIHWVEGFRWPNCWVCSKHYYNHRHFWTLSLYGQGFARFMHNYMQKSKPSSEFCQQDIHMMSIKSYNRFEQHNIKLKGSTVTETQGFSLSTRVINGRWKVCNICLAFTYDVTWGPWLRGDELQLLQW